MNNPGYWGKASSRFITPPLSEGDSPGKLGVETFLWPSEQNNAKCLVDFADYHDSVDW